MKMNLTRRNFIITLTAGAVALTVRSRKSVPKKEVSADGGVCVCQFGSTRNSPPARPRTAAIEYVAMGDLLSRQG